MVTAESYYSSEEEEIESVRNTADLSTFNGREWIKRAMSTEEFQKACQSRLKISSRNKMVKTSFPEEEPKSPRRSMYGRLWQTLLTEARDMQ
jgi:hypothetical protein